MTSFGVRELEDASLILGDPDHRHYYPWSLDRDEHGEVLLVLDEQVEDRRLLVLDVIDAFEAQRLQLHHDTIPVADALVCGEAVQVVFPPPEQLPLVRQERQTRSR